MATYFDKDEYQEVQREARKLQTILDNIEKHDPNCPDREMYELRLANAKSRIQFMESMLQLGVLREVTRQIDEKPEEAKQNLWPMRIAIFVFVGLVWWFARPYFPWNQ